MDRPSARRVRSSSCCAASSTCSPGRWWPSTAPSSRPSTTATRTYRNLTACPTCALKPRCTPDKHKRVKRWQHEDVLDQMQDRLERTPEAMLIRRQTVEHPFGTIKAWMGSTHFLMKTLEKVKTEMSLHVLAYNLKRMINILGVRPLLKALAA